jgi:integrase
MPGNRNPKAVIGPSTERLYAAHLYRAGIDPADRDAQIPDLGDWAVGPRRILRAALRRAGRSDLADRVSVPFAIRRAQEHPDERQATEYERAATLLPRGPRAVALLPLRLGLRAAEVLAIPRSAVQAAVSARGNGRLTVLTKGGKERIVDASKVRGLLEDLLATKPRRQKADLRSNPRPEAREKSWTVIGEIVSGSARPEAQYQALYRLVQRTGRAAGIEVHPHSLRHAYATRLVRDGAPGPVVQAALGHASFQTTQRYIHPTPEDVGRYQR